MDFIVPWPGWFFFFLFLLERIFFWRPDIVYFNRSIPPILSLNGFDGVVFWTLFWTSICFWFSSIACFWIPSWGTKRYPYFVLWNVSIERIFHISKKYRYLYKRTYFTVVSFLCILSLLHSYYNIPFYVIINEFSLIIASVRLGLIHSYFCSLFLFFNSVYDNALLLLSNIEYSGPMCCMTIIGYFLVYFSSPIVLLLLLILFVIFLSSLLFFSSIEFFSMVLIIVYAGAVSILFLFVIMLLNIKNDFFIDFKLRHIFLSFFVVWVVTAYTNYFFDSSILLYNQTLFNPRLAYISDLFSLNILLYTKYSFFIIIIAFILLLTLIGVIGILLG